MKHTLRIPTKEQYAYIEFEFEGTADEAIMEYEHLTRLVKGGTGLPDAQWRKVLDEYLNTGTVANGAEIWGDMNQLQRAVIQELKKSLKRAAAKEHE